jgi:hypothetical protein
MILQHSGMTAGYFSTACIYHCGQSYDRVKEIGMLTQEKCAARDWVWSTTFHSFKAVGDESRASSTLPPPPPPPPFTTPVWRKQESRWPGSPLLGLPSLLPQLTATPRSPHLFCPPPLLLVLVLVLVLPVFEFGLALRSAALCALSLRSLCRCHSSPGTVSIVVGC